MKLKIIIIKYKECNELRKDGDYCSNNKKN